MATTIEKTYHSQPEAPGEGITLPALLRTALRPLASLKLTVALFAMGIFIIWVGTLAQSEKDMWDVINDYFWTPLAFIELQFLFPYQWLPFKVDIPLAYAFPFPGGAAIGVAMAINLLAAHLVRFKIQASGTRLVWGGIITAVGVLLTWLVVASGHNSEGLQVDPPFSWNTLWWFVKLGTIVLWLGLAYMLTRIDHKSQTLLSWISIATTLISGVLLIGLFTIWIEWYPGDPALRVMWQLTQGGLAGVVILIGSMFLFKKRAGIVVIHLAVGLLLIGESYVSYNNVEERMQIREGEATNYARDIRVTELAVVDRSDPKTDHHTVVPEGLLNSGKQVTDAELPFEIEVVEYLKNSDVKPLTPDNVKDNPATAGTGLKYRAVELDASSGTDMGGAVDFASAYVRLIDKEKGEPIGTYLVSQLLSLQDIFEKVTVDGKEYEMGLRFKRTYKPYSIYLQDVQKNDYIGTTTPKDYRSIVTLIDPSRGIERPDVEIWMNNPLRYAGETFYQSNYIPASTPGGKEATDFQVVANTGWMIPYVACMMALIGMAYHFLLTLVRFTNRVSRTHEEAPVATWSWWVTGAAVVLALVLMAGALRPKSSPNGAMDLNTFGNLPVVYQGRTKPLDTLARNTLQAVSDRQTFVDSEGEKQPAVMWLLDLAARPDRSESQKVFRIRNHEVRDMLKLEDTDDDRYALEDIYAQREEFIKQLIQTHKVQEESQKDDSEEQLSAYQAGLLNLEERLKAYEILVASFRPAPLTPIPSEEEMTSNPESLAAMSDELRALLQFLPERMSRIERMQPPLAVPDLESGQWKAYSTEWDMAQARLRIPYVIETSEPPQVSESAKAFHAIFAGYAKDNVKQFNTALAEYEQLLTEASLASYNSERVDFEGYFNRAQPFTTAMIIYLLAFALSTIGMMAWNRELNRAAFWMIMVGLVLHVLALSARVYISGRPPVTNLYSSAIFIGLAGVIFCLIVEAIFRIGVGNLLATVAGVSTLIIASNLGADGDTFTVLQAVLDTNFWLTTHVICVTLGYSTTYVAGLFGAAYLVGRLVSSGFAYGAGKDIIRVCYGVICFAIFFSFLGTVLGGLWADDSWGRFWGWDPKENGALIIVLWNALILHARWGGMVKDRGVATLAVAGNIVTSWSWFGVNQLGIGLHSYGFTSGVVVALALFVASQLFIMLLAVVPDSPVEAKSADK